MTCSSQTSYGQFKYWSLHQCVILRQMRFEKVLKHGCSCFILSNLSLSRSLSAIFGYPPTTPCNLIRTTCPYFSSYTVFVLLINLTSRRIAKSLDCISKITKRLLAPFDAFKRGKSHRSGKAASRFYKLSP